MTIANSNPPDANDVLNVKTYNFDCEVRPSGQKKIYIHIDNTSGTRNVWLYLYGETSEQSIVKHKHNLAFRYTDKAKKDGWQTGNLDEAAEFIVNAGDDLDQISVYSDLYDTTPSLISDVVPGTSVPQAVEIWIDGTQYTASIGDPNTKGATMYDSGNDDWGVDGTTEWSTGKLNITSEISWTAGEHYIEFRETGDTGGRLLANIYINNLS